MLVPPYSFQKTVSQIAKADLSLVSRDAHTNMHRIMNDHSDLLTFPGEIGLRLNTNRQTQKRERQDDHTDGSDPVEGTRAATSMVWARLRRPEDHPIRKALFEAEGKRP